MVGGDARLARQAAGMRCDRRLRVGLADGRLPVLRTCSASGRCRRCRRCRCRRCSSTWGRAVVGSADLADRASTVAAPSQAEPSQVLVDRVIGDSARRRAAPCAGHPLRPRRRGRVEALLAPALPVAPGARTAYVVLGWSAASAIVVAGPRAQDTPGTSTPLEPDPSTHASQARRSRPSAGSPADRSEVWHLAAAAPARSVVYPAVARAGPPGGMRARTTCSAVATGPATTPPTRADDASPTCAHRGLGADAHGPSRRTRRPRAGAAALASCAGGGVRADAGAPGRVCGVPAPAGLCRVLLQRGEHAARGLFRGIVRLTDAATGSTASGSSTSTTSTSLINAATVRKRRRPRGGVVEIVESISFVVQ